jgi:hypothetical protein
MSPNDRVATKTGWMLGVATQPRLDALARSATTQTPVLVTTLRERGGRGAERCCLVLVCINTRRPRRLALHRAHPARGHSGS